MFFISNLMFLSSMVLVILIPKKLGARAHVIDLSSVNRPKHFSTYRFMHVKSLQGQYSHLQSIITCRFLAERFVARDVRLLSSQLRL